MDDTRTPTAGQADAPYEWKMGRIASAISLVLNSRREVDDRCNREAVAFTDNGWNVGSLLSEEMCYLHSTDRKQRLIDTSQQAAFCEVVHVQCELLARAASALPRDSAYDLAQMSLKVAFHSRQHFAFDHAACTLHAGGIALELSMSVRPKAMEWLCKLHKMISIAHQSNAATVSTELLECRQHTFSVLTEILVNRSTLLRTLPDKNGQASVSVGSVHALSALIQPYWVHAIGKDGTGIATGIKVDLDGIEALFQLTRDAMVSPDGARGALVQFMNAAAHVIDKPPLELRASASMKRHPDALHMLRAATERTREEYVLANIVHDWSVRSGMAVMVACKDASEALRRWSMPPSGFVNTIIHSSKQLQYGIPPFTPIPSSAHLPLRDKYVVMREVPCRTGLCAEAESDVRLISAVFTLLQNYGELGEGMVDAGLVADAALTCKYEAAHAYQALCREQHFEGLHIGPTLQATASELRDLGGQFYEAVANASHEVCGLSMSDLFGTMRITNGEVAAEQLGDLTRSLQSLLYCPRRAIKQRVGGDLGEVDIDNSPPLHPMYVLYAFWLCISPIAELRAGVRVGPSAAINPLVSGLATAVGPVALVRALENHVENSTPLRIPVKALRHMPGECEQWLRASMRAQPDSADPANDEWAQRFRLVRHRKRSHRKGMVDEIEIVNVATFAKLVANGCPIGCVDI